MIANQPQTITVNGHTVKVATNVEFRPANVGTKTITSNATYKASDDNLDGYSQVTVNVSGGGGAVLGTKTINNNGTYNASSDSLDGYSQVTVSVPASAVDTGTKSITANGNNQDVVGYAAVNVAVPNSYSAGDEGKVVDDGALVAQTAHADVTPTTSDQTIDTTTNNSIKVKGDANLVAGNIKKDVVIFNTTGSYEGGGDAVMRQVKNIGTDSLAGATIGEVVNFSSLTFLGQHGLQNLIGTKIIVLPKLNDTSNYPVSDCADVEAIDIGSTFSESSFHGSGWFFSEDRKLTTLILRKTSAVIGLPNINCFNVTPFASNGTGGTLYVPSSLVSSYQSASNWSTILGYAHNSIAAIEGSQYENYYADGTPIT